MRPPAGSSRPFATAVLTAATLVAVAATVLPQAGASAGTTAATTTAPRPTCTGCLDHAIDGFESGSVGGWAGTGGATVAVSESLPRTGTKSLVIAHPGVGAGARTTLRTGADIAYVGLSVRVEPIPVAASGTMPVVRSWVRLTLAGDTTTAVVVTSEIGENGWTTLGTWVSGRVVVADLAVVQSCGSAVGRNLYVDDVEIATHASGMGVTPARAPRTTSSPSATDVFATSSPTPSPSGIPTCPDTTTISPSSTTTSPTTTRPTTTSPTTTAAGKVFTFENGKLAGWTGAMGATPVVVQAPDARDGRRVLSVSHPRGSLAAVSWTGKVSTFRGSGTWYHVTIPLRATAMSTAASSVRPSLALTVSGPIDRRMGGSVSIPGTSWTTADLWFTLAKGTKKSAEITLTLGPAPQPACGTPGPMVTAMLLDGITFARSQASPLPTAAALVPLPC